MKTYQNPEIELTELLFGDIITSSLLTMEEICRNEDVYQIFW